MCSASRRRSTNLETPAPCRSRRGRVACSTPLARTRVSSSHASSTAGCWFKQRLRCSRTEHEAKHLSAHDFRHAALTHMAAVGSDLTAIGHVAGHKNATTTALYVHNSEAAARRVVARRAGILDTEVDTVAGQAAEKHPPVRPKFSESLGGPSWTRTRSQWIKNPLLYHLS